MIPLTQLIKRAQHSPTYLWLLNRLLNYVIPFNRPHGLKILSIAPEQVSVYVPFRRSNKNHVQTLHACALATASEFSSGILLLTQLDPKVYRLIIKSLEIKFLYRGTRPAIATATLSQEDLQRQVLDPLQNGAEAATCCFQSVCSDIDGNEISKTQVEWHVKAWQSVRKR